MHFGGFEPLTLTDFPGRVACIAFTQGCNLRCGYCHNPQLIPRQTPAGTETPTEEQILALLKKRQGLLDGVVVSGGEPTLQPDLLEFLAQIKKLGFLVKLDTNGSNPSLLQEALAKGLLDYVAMDVKHDPARYAEIAGVDVDPKLLAASRDLLLASGVAYEFRTTVIPSFHDETMIECIARFCEGASRWVLQDFIGTHALDPALRHSPAATSSQRRQYQAIAERYVGRVELSGGNRPSM